MGELKSGSGALGEHLIDVLFRQPAAARYLKPEQPMAPEEAIAQRGWRSEQPGATDQPTGQPTDIAGILAPQNRGWRADLPVASAINVLGGDSASLAPGGTPSQVPATGVPKQGDSWSALMNLLV